jgi:hypothetical protein
MWVLVSAFMADVPKDTVDLVAKYMEEHRRAYPSDVALALGLSFEETTTIFEQLSREGVIKQI